MIIPVSNLNLNEYITKTIHITENFNINQNSKNIDNYFDIFQYSFDRDINILIYKILFLVQLNSNLYYIFKFNNERIPIMGLPGFSITSIFTIDILLYFENINEFNHSIDIITTGTVATGQVLNYVIYLLINNDYKCNLNYSFYNTSSYVSKYFKGLEI